MERNIRDKRNASSPAPGDKGNLRYHHIRIRSYGQIEKEIKIRDWYTLHDAFPGSYRIMRPRHHKIALCSWGNQSNGNSRTSVLACQKYVFPYHVIIPCWRKGRGQRGSDRDRCGARHAWKDQRFKRQAAWRYNHLYDCSQSEGISGWGGWLQDRWPCKADICAVGKRADAGVHNNIHNPAKTRGFLRCRPGDNRFRRC